MNARVCDICESTNIVVYEAFCSTPYQDPVDLKTRHAQEMIELCSSCATTLLIFLLRNREVVKSAIIRDFRDRERMKRGKKPIDTSS